VQHQEATLFTRLHAVHAGVQHRGIVRRKWTMRRIWIAIAAHFLRISRMLRIRSKISSEQA